MSDFREPIVLQQGSVIDLSGQECGVISDTTVRVEHLLQVIAESLYDTKEWINEGFECEVLVPGGIWKKGKIRLKVVFSSEESDALSEMRQEIEALQNS